MVTGALDNDTMQDGKHLNRHVTPVVSVTGRACVGVVVFRRAKSADQAPAAISTKHALAPS